MTHDIWGISLDPRYREDATNPSGQKNFGKSIEWKQLADGLEGAEILTFLARSLDKLHARDVVGNIVRLALTRTRD